MVFSSLIKRLINGKVKTVETPISNIFLPITPKGLFLHGNPILVFTDTQNEINELSEKIRKDPALYDYLKQNFLDVHFTEKNILDNLKTPIKIHKLNSRLIKLNEKKILLFAKRTESNLIGLSFDKIHALQFNYFKNQFLDCYMSGQFWAAGIAVLMAIEVQMRVLLIQSNVVEKNSLDKQDLGSLIEILKKNINSGKLIVNNKNNFFKSLKVFDYARNRLFAHCFPQELLRKIDEESRKTTTLFGGVNNAPIGDFNNTSLNLISATAQLESIPVINTFYYLKIDEILDAYCLYHSELSNQYRLVFDKDSLFE